MPLTITPPEQEVPGLPGQTDALTNAQTDTPIIKRKVTWIALSGLLTAIAGYYTGDLDKAAAIQTGITSLLSYFLRDAIGKVGR